MSAPRCPLHGPMRLEDVDSAYGQEFYVCRAWPECREQSMRGPSDSDIYRREQGVGYGRGPRRVRTLDEQFAPGWRGI